MEIKHEEGEKIMNNQRRNEIQKAIEKLETIQDNIDFIAGEERDAFDNLPESIQESERGQKMEEAADTLEEVKDAISELVDSLTGAQE